MKALISVFDKSNLEPFARSLVELGWELISTGGTYQALQAAGLPVTAVEEVTGSEEILGGRVKTLHPKIHGGILYKRQDAEHQATVQNQEIPSIDLVVNTLYPFQAAVECPDSMPEEIIEMIDIGGPAMIRATAKNFQDTLIVTDIDDYDRVIKALKEDQNTLEFRRQMAQKAFALTSAYDACIANYLLEDKVNDRIQLSYQHGTTLRYGENPHQGAKYYVKDEAPFQQLHGKELSYNNLNDLTACVDLVKEFEEPVAVAIKHTNPCGVAIGSTALDAYQKAYEADDQSIFGGIVGFNRPVEEDLAQALSEIFLEVIVAPSFSSEALDILQKKKNVRLLTMDDLDQPAQAEPQIRQTLGGLLVQDKDIAIFEKDALENKTQRLVSDQEMQDLLFAWKVAKHLNSNAIVLAKNGQTLGMGHGEVRRSWAVEKAMDRSIADTHEGAVLASDGFFFPDTIEILKNHGVKAVIQPGGSIQDPSVIEAAEEAGMSLLFTHMRHFKH